MKRTLSIVFLTLFLNGNLYAEEISTIIIDKFFQDGQIICAKLGLGKYLLIDNPVKIIDISNDGVKDIILSFLEVTNLITFSLKE